MTFHYSFEKKHYICGMIKYRVQKFIEEKNLFTLKEKVLVALSGGADSVALLRILVSLGYSCECAHCNFHLRGEESDRDEAFVVDLCKKQSTPLHMKHFDTEAYAKDHHLSIEMAARELRYAWFELLREKIGASVIAVAHHRDDSVETFLLNLIRGTGINGLRGIKVQNGNVVRPLLQENREGIIEYLNRIHQDFITDSTNLQDQYTRNKIRLNIIPLMKEINPSVMESIQETSFRLSEVADVYHINRKQKQEEFVQKISDGLLRISIQDVLKDIAPNSLLFELLSPLGFNSDQIKDIHRSMLQHQSGKRFLSQKWEVIRDREYLWIQRLGGQTVIPSMVLKEVEYNTTFIIPKDNRIACVDADKITKPLTIRKWQMGDKFVPFGMNGKKKVSDYMTDKKFSLIKKEHQYVVCCGEQIVWLVNERIDNRFRITEQTQRIFLIKIEEDGK